MCDHFALAGELQRLEQVGPRADARTANRLAGTNRVQNVEFESPRSVLVSAFRRNPARVSACRNTDDFSVPAQASLVGGFSEFPRKPSLLRQRLVEQLGLIPRRFGTHNGRLAEGSANAQSINRRLAARSHRHCFLISLRLRLPTVQSRASWGAANLQAAAMDVVG